MGREFPPAALAIQNIVLQLGREIRKIVLPSPCVSCDDDLPPRARIGSCCRRCWLEMPELTPPWCPLCGTSVSLDVDECLGCRGRSPLAWRDSWGSYEAGLRDVLHAYKFSQHDFLASPLAELLRVAWYRRARSRVDAIVPIPSSRRRKRERGYDHALLLAKSFSRRTHLRLDPRLLRRLRENDVQSLLPRSRRAANVRGVFDGDERAAGMSILIVDDIETTGETLKAAARALRRAGAVSVAALTVARALKK